MVEQDNGQGDHPKPKRHNAKLCSFAIRQQIVNTLANGDSIRSIARRFHVSNNTVVAIRDQDWQQVAARKGRIAAQSERNATLAADRITAKLESDENIPLNVLVPVYGVSVDKMLALRGDTSLAIRHDHFHRITDDDLVAFALHRSKLHEKPVKAKVIAETHSLAEKTRGKKKAP